MHSVLKAGASEGHSAFDSGCISPSQQPISLKVLKDINHKRNRIKCITNAK